MQKHEKVHFSHKCEEVQNVALPGSAELRSSRLLKYDGESFQRIALAFTLIPLKTPPFELAVNLFPLKTQDLRLKTLKTLINRESYRNFRIKDLI